MGTTTQHPSTKRFFLSARFLSAATLYLSLQHQQIHAQADSPVVVFGPAFARTSTRLYVLGGFPSYVPAEMNSMNQFYSLELSKPWTSKSPAWSQHNPGPQKAIFPGAFSADQKTMVVFHTAKANSPFAAWRYTVDSDSWTPSNASFPFQDRSGLASVTDPNTGLVYTAGGYVSPTEGVAVDVYNFDEDSVSTVSIPDTFIGFSTRYYYTSVWSQQRKSILYFGGYPLPSRPTQAVNSVTEFVPASNMWQTMPTTGSAPSIRGSHCMAANEDGTVVIVYGGKLSGAPTINAGDIYILNTVTGIWTTGKTGSPRIYATCTIAGDQFLVWGGATTDDAMPSSDVLIYNIASDNWVTSYTPPASYLSPSPTSGTAPQPSSVGDSGSDGKNSSSVGGIVGGVVGGLVVVGVALVLLYRRRRIHLKTVTGESHKEGEPKAQHNQRQPKEKLGGGNDEQQTIETLQSQLQIQQERQDALQRQVELLQTLQQTQAAPSPYDSTYAYQPPIIDCAPPQNPKIFEPSMTTRFTHNPSAVIPGPELNAAAASSSNPVVYDPVSSSSSPGTVLRPKNPETLSHGVVQVEAPRSGHPHAPVSQIDDVYACALAMHSNNPHS
ncbi:hypothetical protein EC991_010646 [Linnemannia zychae]|nr:hypothetical protein EC991_010646 [Linnemannia zychae]